MATNKLVTRKNITFSLDKKLIEVLNNISNETMIPKTRLMDKAILLLAREYDVDLSKIELN